MLTRGMVIALIDLSIISLGSVHWNFGVLFAISVSMICMVPLRRLPTRALLALAVGWMLFGEIVTGSVWSPPGNSSVPAALTVANYATNVLVIKYPVVPWLESPFRDWSSGATLSFLRRAWGPLKTGFTVAIGNM